MRHLTLPLILALLTCTACGEDTEEITPTPTPQPATATFASFNVGLARGFVPYAEDRLAPLGEAIHDDNSDVICLQEVWSQEDIDALLAATEHAWPHNYYFKTASDEVNAGCTPEEVDPLQACIETNCADVPQDGLASCGLSNCGAEFMAASSACQGCIASNLDKPIDEIVAVCGGGGPAFAYGGHNGLLLLSKHPLKDTEHLLMTSAVTQRSVLRARVELPEFGEATVYCTHLAADLSASLPYPEGREHSSYPEEQAAQIDAALDWIDGHGDEGVVLLMGDFNTGPALDGIAAEVAENFPTFAARGWTSTLAVDTPQCTFCADNRVQGGGADSKLAGGESGVLIDHIFIKTPLADRVLIAARAFDQTQPIQTTAEGTLDLHLSDHYGLRATINAE
jgi:endonuclease/exonuclease/phosphatase family metal-dependent hydrolase